MLVFAFEQLLITTDTQAVTGYNVYQTVLNDGTFFDAVYYMNANHDLQHAFGTFDFREGTVEQTRYTLYADTDDGSKWDEVVATYGA